MYLVASLKISVAQAAVEYRRDTKHDVNTMQSHNTDVAVTDRTPTLFRCAFQPHYRVQSAVAQIQLKAGLIHAT